MGTRVLAATAHSVVMTVAMLTPASFGILRRTVLCAAAVLAANLSGCAAVSQHFAGMYSAVVTKCQVHHDLAEIRQDTREALVQEEVKSRKLAAERDVEAARMASERQRLEIQFCQANQEALQRKVKHNIREQLEHKVSFNVEQGLELGELEVDVEGLQALMKKREQEAQKRPPPEAQKRPCKCCDQPCGCEPGLLRRLCPHCRHKPCEAEKTCGGPEALARLEQEAVKRPLRPAEIPLRIPVRLTFGMQGPEMEAARIRRLPYPQDNEPLDRGPCTLPCTDPSCPACTKSAPPAAMLPPSASDSPVIPAAPEAPPVPTVDEEARRQKTSPAPVKRITRKASVFPDFVWRDLSGQKSTVQPAAASRKVDAR